jgi:predicted metal-dependent phosphotriesterase family hydrolase
MKDLETVLNTEDGVRVCVDEFGENVWFGFQARNSTFHTQFTRTEAEQIIVALQKVLAIENV